MSLNWLRALPDEEMKSRLDLHRWYCQAMVRPGGESTCSPTVSTLFVAVWHAIAGLKVIMHTAIYVVFPDYYDTLYDIEAKKAALNYLFTVFYMTLST